MRLNLALAWALGVLPFNHIVSAQDPSDPSPNPDLAPIPDRQCGTTDPPPALTYAHSYLSWLEPLDNSLENATTVESRLYTTPQGSRRRKRQAPNPLFVIDVYIHVIVTVATSTPNSPGYVTDVQIRAQFEYLARSFTNAGIGFRLRGWTRRTNDTWARNGDDEGMKRALRRGTYRTLNIYYQAQLQASSSTPGIPQGSILLGFCSLPSAGIRANTPPIVYTLDGCNILSATMPGGTQNGYNQGGSTVHEVGHWCGLFHTFQGNSCDLYDFGDYVADTPQQATSTNGCPRGKDSCPNSGVPSGFDGSNGESLRFLVGSSGWVLWRCHARGFFMSCALVLSSFRMLWLTLGEPYRWSDALQRPGILWVRSNHELHGLLDGCVLLGIHAGAGGEDAQYLAHLQRRAVV